jgi:hypothetical protein
LVRILALPTNISLGGKGLTGTNTLAYYGHELITAVKSFMTLGPGLHSEPSQLGRNWPETGDKPFPDFINSFSSSATEKLATMFVPGPMLQKNLRTKVPSFRAKLECSFLASLSSKV